MAGPQGGVCAARAAAPPGSCSLWRRAVKGSASMSTTCGCGSGLARSVLSMDSHVDGGGLRVRRWCLTRMVAWKRFFGLCLAAGVGQRCGKWVRSGIVHRG
jgi:hypothetical protein